MAHPARTGLVVLFSIFLAAHVRAADPLPKAPAGVRRAALEKAGYTHIPLTGPQNLYYHVEGAVGPEKVKFFLDSGCGATVLDMKLAKKLKLELGAESGSVGVGGQLAARETDVPGLLIGTYDTHKDWHRWGVDAAELSGWPMSPAVLGADLLDAWGAVIDYPGRALYLRSPLTAAWPRLAGTWTVTAWQEDGAARKLDPKTPPTFTFADRRLKLTDGGKTTEYAIRLIPDIDGGDVLRLFDPKEEGKPDPVYKAGGFTKMADGRMTACLALDLTNGTKPPAEFAAPKGSGHVLLELTRATPAPKPLPDPLRDLLIKGGYTAVRLDREPDGLRMVTARVGKDDLRMMVDTGANVTAFDNAGLDKWGAQRMGATEASALAGKAKVEQVKLRGLTLGGYDTRRGWQEAYGAGVDLTGSNKALAGQKRKPIHGILGGLELLNGSAVIDYGTDTLYLRPVKEALRPRLDGKWVAVSYESDGQKGKYAPGDLGIEFKGDRVEFVTPDKTMAWGFHVQDVGDWYRLGLFDAKADELADGFGYSSGGLIKLDGDTLTVVMTPDGTPVKKVPTEFAAPKGSKLLLVEFKRVK